MADFQPELPEPEGMALHLDSSPVFVENALPLAIPFSSWFFLLENSHTLKQRVSGANASAYTTELDYLNDLIQP